MLLLIASCLVTAHTALTSDLVLRHPLATYDRVLCWHQVWDGADWKWTPADVCPICCHHVVPRPVPSLDDRFICPACSGVVTETEWDQFNARRAWWVGWPSDPTTIGGNQGCGR